MAKRTIKRPPLDKIASGEVICTPGCASSRTPHSLDCKCFCRGVGHGMLYQAGLTDIDRARLRADAVGRLEYEVTRVKARFTVAPKLADLREKAGKAVRTFTYASWKGDHPTWTLSKSFLKSLEPAKRSA